jgi:hypothetical protein
LSVGLPPDKPSDPAILQVGLQPDDAAIPHDSP